MRLTKKTEFAALIFATLTTLVNCGNQGGGDTGAGQLLIPSIDYQFIKRDFKLDSSMKLTTMRRYHIHGQTQAAGFNDGSNNNSNLISNLTANYHYEVLLAPADTGSHSTPDPFLAMDSGDTKISNGFLDLDISLPIEMNDYPIMMARAKLVIELTPREKAPKIATLWAPFEFQSESGKLDLLPNDHSIGEAVAALKPMLKTQSASSSEQSLSQKTNVSNLNIGDLQRLGILQDEMQRGLQDLRAQKIPSLKFTSAFCDLFFTRLSISGPPLTRLEKWYEKIQRKPEPPTSQYIQCKSEPRKFINFIPLQYVFSIDSEPKLISSDSHYFIISDGTFKENTTGHQKAENGTRETYFAYNDAEAGVGFNYGFFKMTDNVGFRYGNEWFGFDQDFSANLKGHRSSITRNRNIQVDELEFSFSATTQDCLLVSQVTGWHSSKSFQYCFEAPTPKTDLTESWYFLNQVTLTPALSIMRDKSAVDELLFSSIIRGEYIFSAFVKNLSERLNAGLNSKAHSHQYRGDGGIPRILFN
jgi:hypothetical protein